jgi:hypothetical protein
MADMETRIARFIEPFRVNPGSSVRLAQDFDPAFEAGVKKKKKKDGVELLKDGIELLSEYQARLAAQDTYGVLVVLQALDAAGKDGTIRHVMSGVNPQGVRVESFKVPSARELDQDPYAATRNGCRRGARSPSSTGPTTRKCWSSVCIPRTSYARSSQPRPASTTSGNADTKRSTTGSGISPATAFGS